MSEFVTPYLERNLQHMCMALIFVDGDPGIPVSHVEGQQIGGVNCIPTATVILPSTEVQIFYSLEARMIAALEPGYKCGLVIDTKQGTMLYKDWKFSFGELTIDRQPEIIEVNTIGFRSPYHLGGLYSSTIKLTLPVRNYL